jgi:hypothetical protein
MQKFEVQNNKPSLVLRVSWCTASYSLWTQSILKLLNNDLTFDRPIGYARYVDANTVISVSADPNHQSLQLASDRL